MVLNPHGEVMTALSGCGFHTKVTVCDRRTTASQQSQVFEQEKKQFQARVLDL